MKKISIKVPKGSEENYNKLTQEEKLRIKIYLSDQLKELLKKD